MVRDRFQRIRQAEIVDYTADFDKDQSLIWDMSIVEDDLTRFLCATQIVSLRLRENIKVSAVQHTPMQINHISQRNRRFRRDYIWMERSLECLNVLQNMLDRL